MLALTLSASLLLCVAGASPTPAKTRLLSALRGRDPLLASPESLRPLTRITSYLGPLTLTRWEDEFGTEFPVVGEVSCLTPPQAERPLWELSLKELVGQKLFQSPLMSGVYERGYRQNFENFGFPGIEKEFRELDAFFRSVNASTVLDLSCGSGFMTRNLLKANHYARVISGDLSLAMLQETRARCVAGGLVPELVRMDAGKLPIASGALDGVHAGAAMHCWPRVPQVLAEVHRVLRPGGVFFASTILVKVMGGARIDNGFTYFDSVEQLEGLVRDAGFADVHVRQEGRGCAIIRATKAPIAQ